MSKIETRIQSMSNNSSANDGVRSKSLSEIIYAEKDHNLRVFSLSELHEATNGFSRSLQIGEGVFDEVYKGEIKSPDGHGDSTIVAIKRLNTQRMQGHKQWLAEVQDLGIVDHPNLVKLIGHCATEENGTIHRLLVYEYVENKSLEDHLFGKVVRTTLTWRTRLEIMLGSARGLAYLHEGIEEIQVIHQDFKSSNVLLDKYFNPKLSDFALARQGPREDRSHVSIQRIGTLGYAAPEYIETGHLSFKSDVYSFGVVLYEIVTGRRTLERNRPPTERFLLDWVKRFPADSKKFDTIIDPRVRNQCSLTAVRRIAKLADSCLSKKPKDRPTMIQVVEVLKQVIQDEESSKGSEGSEIETIRDGLFRRIWKRMQCL